MMRRMMVTDFLGKTPMVPGTGGLMMTLHATGARQRATDASKRSVDAG